MTMVKVQPVTTVAMTTRRGHCFPRARPLNVCRAIIQLLQEKDENGSEYEAVQFHQKLELRSPIAKAVAGMP